MFIVPLQIATLMLMPQAIRNTRYKRPLTLVQGMAVLGAAAGAAAVIWWLVSHRTAESESRARAGLNFFCHTLFAVPLWLLFLYLGYRCWRRKPPLKDQLDLKPGQP
ncbi:MAG: hypothetical protein J0L73_28295 [Verrucomicrobia bacterium]|nr:hypothetical protein [Verrucomicrobiota bacterium]